jgi:hypothetical protein
MNAIHEFGYFNEKDGLFLRYTNDRCLIVRRNEGVDCALEELPHPPARNDQVGMTTCLSGWSNMFLWLGRIQARRKEKR